VTLDGIHLKLDRADEHLRILKDEMLELLDSKTYTVTEQANTKGSEHVLEVLDPPVLPPEWSLLIGDFAYNLRAALDYLAWQLALLNTRGRSRIAANRAHQPWPPQGTQFPICADISTRKKKKAFERRLRPFLARHRQRIRGEQPYQRGGRSEAQPLWLLHELRNVDAHRVLHTILGRVALPEGPLHRVSLTDTGGLRVEPGHAHIVESGGLRVDISEDVPYAFQELTIPPLAPGDYVTTTLKIQANFAVHVTFDERGSVLHDQEVLPLLDRVRVDVRRVIDRFAA